MKFRKRPVVIEAFRLGFHAMPAWAVDNTGFKYRKDNGEYFALIETPEGAMRANIGDWIILCVNGDLYPCRHEIFMATYEPAGTLQWP